MHIETTDRKSIRPWGASLVLVAIMVTADSSAKNLRVDGLARLEDGTPIRGGTVIASELKPKIGQMPSVRMLTRAITNGTGAFVLMIEDIEGDLDIELIDDQCSWRGGYKLLNAMEFKEKNEIHIELIAVVDDCNDPLK